MRIVIFAHFSPSIPPRGVVAISPLFHFRRGEIFAFALVGDIYPSYENRANEALYFAFFGLVCRAIFSLIRERQSSHFLIRFYSVFPNF